MVIHADFERARSHFTVDAEGWVEPACRIVSPNCDERPASTAIELIVIHAISLPPGDFGGPAVAQLFTNTLDCSAHPYYQSLRGLRVSAHFFIRRDGCLVQFVACSQRAWHAGISVWRSRARCNDFSIGIELEGVEHAPFESAQYEVCNLLIGALARAYPLADVVGHSDLAPGRKTDPGPHFDWSRIAPLP